MFEIGAGGMATVYLARDLKHERWVAVKVLRPEVALAVGVKGFLREIRIAAGLQHPNIVPVFDSGEAEGRVYYVMPQVQGESLRARLQRERTLPLDEALRLTWEVADALAYAHTQGIVHRDIKPENILLSGHEGSPVCHAMVTDFGIARAVAQSGAEEQLTETGVVVGTPTYMSPEQAAAGEPLDGRCDVYSLGCVLYEMIAGSPPFVGATRFAVLAKHADAPIPSLLAIRPEVSAPLQAAVERALAKQPADRFVDAAAFARAIREASGSSIVVPDGSANPAPNDSSSRRVLWRRTPVTSGTVVATALAVGMWLGSMSGRLPASPDNARVGSGRESVDGFLGGFPAADIAVLYFDDLSPGRRLQYLADGLTEALIRDLSRVPRLHVASRNGVAASRGRASLRTDSLGLALRVGTLVRGSVTSVGSGVRITIELVDPLSGRTVASNQIEQPEANGIVLEDSLARAVTELLRQRLDASVPRIASDAGTLAPLAWDAKQRARSAALEADRCMSAGDTAAALHMLSVADSTLTIAEARDPNWTEPIVERARLASQRARLVPPSTAHPDEEIVVGLGHANRALRTAPNDAGALEMRGTLNYLRWLYHLPPPDSLAHVLRLAEQDLLAATAGETQPATAWYTLSHLRLRTGNNAGAAVAAENALRLDPFLPRADFTVQRLFLLALDRGDRDEARKWCDAGYRRFPESYRFLECQLWLFALPAPKKPDMVSAWSTYDAYAAASPANVREFHVRKGRLIVALAFVQAGHPDSAEALAAASQGDSLIDPAGELTALAATVYARTGAREKALTLLGKASTRARASVELIDQSWWLNDLRSDPRYQALLHRPR